MDDKERSVLLYLFPDDAQRQIREMFPWANDYTVVQLAPLKTVTLDDGLVMKVAGNEEKNIILSVTKPTP